SIAKKIVELVQTNSLGELGRLFAYALAELYYEKTLGIKTLGYLDQHELALANRDSSFYAATAYWDFRKAMSLISISREKDVFLDYGSGMGRAVIMAGTYPFARVLGVEVSEKLNDIASDNLQRAKKKLKCSDIQLTCGDAGTFEVPRDVTVVYMYNPFRNDLLVKVLDNIYESLRQRPRNLRLIFKNTTHFEKIAHRCTWLQPFRSFKCVTGHKCMIMRGRV
ncbi:MAG TPA: class I SAM-dependent methyltransferase, partial [Phycisphaerae bacterium]|nr:class I SAM-dependent methyltransferase [Phycisphaerae bacterium]